VLSDVAIFMEVDIFDVLAFVGWNSGLFIAMLLLASCFIRNSRCVTISCDALTWQVEFCIPCVAGRLSSGVAASA
jgi:hypothetical protein